MITWGTISLFRSEKQGSAALSRTSFTQMVQNGTNGTNKWFCFTQMVHFTFQNLFAVFCRSYKAHVKTHEPRHKPCNRETCPLAWPPTMEWMKCFGCNVLWFDHLIHKFAPYTALHFTHTRYTTLRFILHHFFKGSKAVALPCTSFVWYNRHSNKSNYINGHTHTLAALTCITWHVCK